MIPDNEIDARLEELVDELSLKEVVHRLSLFAFKNVASIRRTKQYGPASAESWERDGIKLMLLRSELNN